MRKLKYSFNNIKESYNYNNPTVIQDEEDLTDVNTAFDYLKNKIILELDESIDYIKKAIDLVGSRDDWADKFRIMSENKQKEALELYTMFTQLYSENKKKDAYITSIRDAVMDIFSDKMTKVENYKVTYNLIVKKEES